MPKTVNQNESPIKIKKLIISVVFGLAVFLISVTAVALLSSKSAYPKENMMSYLLVCSLISGFFSGLFSTLKERKNGLVSGLITGIALAFSEVLLICAISLFNVTSGILLIIPCCIIPAAISGIIGVNINIK